MPIQDVTAVIDTETLIRYRPIGEIREININLDELHKELLSEVNPGLHEKLVDKEFKGVLHSAHHDIDS